ncbi:LacI family DNA-binding transcriptional regulator [Marinivivus vitaminiproducens]|uniref:LacI family DNA-binding transcriptional regulator n=1 Tax=Marinivivus vitaminiproducens TaxID=3035935 RepID=UPI0027AB588F|nr:LacI family DNA-binding transcriptional regulator [Geminicoccaceae bacterium SCSIO 64248]
MIGLGPLSIPAVPVLTAPEVCVAEVRRRRRPSASELRVRLSDVAAEANVSAATVSRYLNTPAIVSEAVRQRVAVAIERLGYVPDGAARALASQKTRIVGAIVPTIDHAIFSRAIFSFQKRLAENGYTLLLATHEYQPDIESRQVTAFLEKGIEGLMLVGERRPEAIYDLLASRRVPFINTWLYRPDAPYPCCGFDHVEALHRVVNHLAGLGHRRIGIVTGITSLNDRVATRLEGIRRGLKENDIAFNPAYLVECRYSVEEGRKSAHHLLQCSPPPTAIICGNDVLAVGVLFHCLDAGLAVPADISIIGFGDYELSSQLSPPLSTVHVPKDAIGRLAAEYLLGRIDGTAKHDHIRLETELCLRGTTAKPAAGSRRSTPARSEKISIDDA